MNRTAVAQELLKLARSLVALEFNTEAEKKKYEQEHDVRPGTKLEVKSPSKDKKPVVKSENKENQNQPIKNTKPAVENESEKVKRDAEWHRRFGRETSIEDNPFVEGAPSQERAKEMTAWVNKKKNEYDGPKYVKFYHCTSASLPIEEEGLKPTSLERRRSYQSQSGYVYLANTPKRAETFGSVGSGGQPVAVYEVLVKASEMLPDLDQLKNQRSVGEDLGNSIGESIVYGGGIRVKGKIDQSRIMRIK